MSNKKPYISNVINEYLEIRGFYSDTPKNLLEWHRDEEDRTLMVQEGSGWYLQKDNSIPFKLEPGMFYQIPAGMYHRLIREARSSDLLLIIEKKNKKLSKKQKKIAQAAPPEDEITGADFKALRDKKK